jgi:hypothetical protein
VGLGSVAHGLNLSISIFFIQSIFTSFFSGHSRRNSRIKSGKILLDTVILKFSGGESTSGLHEKSGYLSGKRVTAPDFQIILQSSIMMSIVTPILFPKRARFA